MRLVAIILSLCVCLTIFAANNGNLPPAIFVSGLTLDGEWLITASAKSKGAADKFNVILARRENNGYTNTANLTLEGGIPDRILLVRSENCCIITCLHENATYDVALVHVLNFGPKGLVHQKSFLSAQVFSPLEWKKIPGAEGMKFWYEGEPVIHQGDRKVIFNSKVNSTTPSSSRLIRLELDLAKLTLLPNNLTP